MFCDFVRNMNNQKGRLPTPVKTTVLIWQSSGKGKCKTKIQKQHLNKYCNERSSSSNCPGMLVWDEGGDEDGWGLKEEVEGGCWRFRLDVGGYRWMLLLLLLLASRVWCCLLCVGGRDTGWAPVVTTPVHQQDRYSSAQLSCDSWQLHRSLTDTSTLVITVNNNTVNIGLNHA